MTKISRREILRRSAGLACIAASRAHIARAFSGVAPRAHWDVRLAAKLALDPRRPQYHLLPKAYWMNDPDGPIYWKGNYHMFFQYNPNGAYWGDMHWGHAVSPDMIHWRHLPVALAPTPGGPDAAGCFSGSSLIDGERLAVLYTGVVTVPTTEATLYDGVHSFRESQCLAYSNDSDLKFWTKLPGPVIAAPPKHLSVTGFRDPSPWRHGNEWLMTVGSGFPQKGGAVLLYRSQNLRHWDYLHPLITSNAPGGRTVNPVDSGDMWECPDFFPLGNMHVLIYSTQGTSRWMTGEFDQQSLTFRPEQSGILDTGAFYAAKTQTDKSGNRILWGWIPERRRIEQYRAAGWAGLMSLPRVLTLGNDRRLRMRIAPEVRRLRLAEQKLSLAGNEEQRSQQIGRMTIQAACGEIACLVQRDKQVFGLALYAEPRGGDNAVTCLSLRFDPASPDRINLDNDTLPLASGNASTEIRLNIDSSIIEVIVDNRVAHTKRFYLPGNQPRNLRLKWIGSTAIITTLSVWQIAPISRDRLTT